MAEAMIAPLCALPPSPSKPVIKINELNKDRSAEVASAFDIEAIPVLEESVEGADMIIMAVKPQNVQAVFERLEPVLSRRPSSDKPVVLSICAGVPIRKFVQGLGCSKVVRSMPNTPSMIQQGMTVWAMNEGGMFTEGEEDMCRGLLACLGSEVMVEDEKFIDMATSISGSGPAYIFLLVESMVDTAVHMGFSRDTATKLVLQTILGSALYAMDTGDHPTILKNSVTSPAGTTASALNELERGSFKTVISDAIWACYRRSLEMGDNDSNIGPGRTRLPSTEFQNFDFSAIQRQQRK